MELGIRTAAVTLRCADVVMLGRLHPPLRSVKSCTAVEATGDVRGAVDPALAPHLIWAVVSTGWILAAIHVAQTCVGGGQVDRFRPLDPYSSASSSIRRFN